MNRAGDAAHSFPPTGGLGLNSGLADVHNLAYKLAAIHLGHGGASLHQAYENERRHVALVNSQQSVKNGQQIFGLLKTLGTTDNDLATAKKNLYRRITDPATRSEVLKGVENQREHFDNLGLHIGYVYGDTEIPASASLYTASYRAGARLPHAWLSGPPSSHLTSLPAISNAYVSELSHGALAEKQYSTLDLISFDAFTLVFSSIFAAEWTAVFSESRLRLAKSNARTLQIKTAALGKDFNLVAGARANEWVMGMQLEHGSAVLVRPDQHILNCYSAGTKVDELLEGLLGHLGVR